MISELFVFHFIIKHQGDFVKTLKDGVLNHKQFLIGAIFRVGSFFQQITDDVKVISLDRCNKGGLRIAGHLVDIHLVLFDKELHKVKIAVITASV